MKKMLLLLSILSLCFSNVIISYDLDWQFSISGSEITADSGALSIGYEDLVSDNMMIGASYDIIGAEYDGLDGEAQLINFYGKYIIPINNNSFWATLGYCLPTGDSDDVDGGISYGFGLSHSSGVGFYYIINNLEYPESYAYYSFDAEVTRMGLFYSF